MIWEEQLQNNIWEAEEKGIEILADEHCRFMPLDGRKGLIPSIYNHSNTVVAVGSMIKCLACVGLRIGWIIENRELIEYYGLSEPVFRKV